MFWNREKSTVPAAATAAASEIPGPSAQAHFREDLRQRLRLVAELATLGAYDLTNGGTPAAHGDTPHAREGEPTRRVFLFTRVPEARCSHSAAASRACPVTADARLAHQARPSERRRVARRRGAVEVAQQPCMLGSVETVAGRPTR